MAEKWSDKFGDIKITTEDPTRAKEKITENDFRNSLRNQNNDGGKVTENDFKKSLEPEKTEKKGGSYSEVKENSDGSTHEVHHMPADSASELSRDDGPAIKMEKEDHKQTGSYGNSKEAQEYREKQKELIEQGKFREAFEMDVEDIREKFGDKYDDAIAEAREYVNTLEGEKNA